MNADIVNSNKKNKRLVKALVVAGKMRPESKTLPEQTFSSMYANGDVIEPPFDPLCLSMLKEQNSELRQCIEAMTVNIDGFGFRFIPRVKDPEQQLNKVEQLEMKKERVFLENFFAYAAGYDSFTTLRKKMRFDQEEIGNSWTEVLRSIDGSIAGFNHIPAYQMRLGKNDENPILVDMKILQLQLDGSVVVKKIKVYQRFRKHVQVIAEGSTTQSGQVRWFKSYGDPRMYDNTTGEELTDIEAAKLPKSRLANEVIHGSIYAQRSPYGIPRYIGNLLSILGDRASEEVNYKTLRSNNIPSMAVLVSNGMLSEGTIKRVESFVESQIQGSDNYSKFLIMEAETDSMDGEDSGNVKMDIKPLTQHQHTDELFQNYSKNNQVKIRRAFRLPPILIGSSSDYSRSIADTSRRVADEQVFAPERGDFDSMMNRIIFPEMGIRYYQFKSNTPNVTDTTEIVRALGMTEKTGALTPRIAREVLEEVFSKDLPEFPANFPADLPFSMIMAEAVKNKADPTEPGQQVTALKSFFDAVVNQINSDDPVEAIKKLLIDGDLKNGKIQSSQ